MRKTPHRMRGIATMIAAFALVGSAAAGSAASGTIKIGVPVPLSGSYASAGEDILNGAKLAADDINRKGGINGMKIEIVSADDACDAQTAAQAADKLIAEGVTAAAGGYCSSASLPELSVFHKQGIPYVMDASTNPQLTEMGYKEAFRDIGRDDQQGPFAAKFVKEVLHAKTLAVLNDNTTYSKGLADAVIAAAEKDGVKVVYNDSITPGQTDYTPTLTKIRSLNPDVFYYTGYYPEFALLVKEGKQLGMKTQLMGGDANQDPTLLKTAGPAADGVLITTAPLAQFISGAHGYVGEYTKAYGHGPGPYSVYEYDCVGITAQAIKNAGSTDPAKIIAALHAIKSYPGVTGDISFKPNGDRRGVNYIVLTVRNGTFVAYKRLNQAGQWTAMK